MSNNKLRKIAETQNRKNNCTLLSSIFHIEWLFSRYGRLKLKFLCERISHCIYSFCSIELTKTRNTWSLTAVMKDCCQMVLLFWFCLILLFSCVVVVVIVIVIWSLDLTFPVIPRLMQSPHKLLLVMTLLPYRVQNRLRVAKCHGTGAYRHFLLSVMFLMVFNFQGMVTNQSCSIHRRPPCNREAQENSEPGNGDCYKANGESKVS